MMTQQKLKCNYILIFVLVLFSVTTLSGCQQNQEKHQKELKNVTNNEGNISSSSGEAKQAQTTTAKSHNNLDTSEIFSGSKEDNVIRGGILEDDKDELKSEIQLSGEESYNIRKKQVEEKLTKIYGDIMIDFLLSVSEDNKVLVMKNGDNCQVGGDGKFCDSYLYGIFDLDTNSETFLGETTKKLLHPNWNDQFLDIFDSLHNRVIQGFYIYSQLQNFNIKIYDIDSVPVQLDEIMPSSIGYSFDGFPWVISYNYDNNSITLTSLKGSESLTLNLDQDDLGIESLHIPGKKCPFESDHPFRDYHIGNNYETLNGILCNDGRLIDDVTVDTETLFQFKEGFRADKNNYYTLPLVKDGDPLTWQKMDRYRSKDSKLVYYHDSSVRILSPNSFIVQNGLARDDSHLYHFLNPLYGDYLLSYVGEIDGTNYEYLGPAHWREYDKIFTLGPLGSMSADEGDYLYQYGTNYKSNKEIASNLDVRTTVGSGYYVFDHDTIHVYEQWVSAEYTEITNFQDTSGIEIIGSFYYIQSHGILGKGSKQYSGIFTLVERQGNTAVLKDTNGKWYILQNGPYFKYSELFQIENIDSGSFEITKITKHQDLRGFIGETIIIGGSDINGDYLFVIPEGHDALGNILLYIIMIEDTDQQDVFFERDEERQYYHAYIDGIQVSHRYTDHDEQDLDVLTGFTLLPKVIPSN